MRYHSRWFLELLYGPLLMTRISLLLLLALLSVGTQAATIVPSPPLVAAKAYLLVDAARGAVLAEHNADMPLPPASLR